MISLPSKPISTAGLKKAIEILGSECYGAMNVCNMLGGIQTEEWEILHNNNWADIVEEGKTRGINFSEMKCAVTDSPLLASATIQFAMGQITDQQRKIIFAKHVKFGDGKWPEPIQKKCETI